MAFASLGCVAEPVAPVLFGRCWGRSGGIRLDPDAIRTRSAVISLTADGPGVAAMGPTGAKAQPPRRGEGLPNRLGKGDAADAAAGLSRARRVDPSLPKHGSWWAVYCVLEIRAAHRGPGWRAAQQRGLQAPR